MADLINFHKMVNFIYTIKYRCIICTLSLVCLINQLIAQDSLKTTTLNKKILFDTSKIIVLNVNEKNNENRTYNILGVKINFQIILDCIQILGFMGFILAIYQIFLLKKQLIEAQKANSGIIYLRLHDFWKSLDIYEASSYIHLLRREWKRDDLGIDEWKEITRNRAKNWVIENYPPNNNNNDAKENWNKRRLLAQFFHQMTLLIQANYISKNDFFSMVPEAKRLLCILIPIENAIYTFLEENEIKEVKIDGWDFTACKKLDLLDEYFDEWIINDAPTYYKNTIINLEGQLNKKR